MMTHSPPLCPYCDVPSVLATGADIYPWRPDLESKQFYKCTGCPAYVGCHADGRPLGTPARKKLRGLRREAHEVFDKRWRTGSPEARRTWRKLAYHWLSLEMDLPQEETHIGMFDEEQCLHVIRLCTKADPHLLPSGRKN